MENLSSRLVVLRNTRTEKHAYMYLCIWIKCYSFNFYDDIKCNAVYLCGRFQIEKSGKHFKIKIMVILILFSKLFKVDCQYQKLKFKISRHTCNLEKARCQYSKLSCSSVVQCTQIECFNCERTEVWRSLYIRYTCFSLSIHNTKWYIQSGPLSMDWRYDDCLSLFLLSC